MANKIDDKNLHYSDLLQDLMDNSPDVIYFKDRKGRLILVNRAHAKGLGVTPQQVVGKTDFDIFPKERACKMLEDDMHVIKTGKPIIDKIERATRADGIDNYVSTTKIPRFDKKRNIIGLIGITRDITRRMQLERFRHEKELIEKKLQALEELNKLKSDFVSVVSHELRTPLAIVKEAVSLLSDEITGPVNDKQREILIKARNNIERLKKIIEELLDISRIESGRIKLHYSLINLNDLLKDSEDFFVRQAQNQGVGLEYSLPKKQVNIFIDAERINQVISNLINNALKFTDTGGKINVEVALLENKVRVEVIDTGVGISKPDLAKLFNKFVQVSGLASSERKGLGLGLYISREIIAKHGGEIWAESKLGVGSKFYFTLPCLYTTNLLDKPVRERIDELLMKDVPVYLVNILVINFKRLKPRIKINPKKFLQDLNNIINTAIKKSSYKRKDRPEIFLSDTERGEWSVLLPKADEKEANQFCILLKDKLHNYMREKRVDDIFVNLVTLSYSPEGFPQTNQQLLAHLNVKKIHIGSEVRRFKRISYKADIEIIHTENNLELSQTVDISLGGLCFISKVLLVTDSSIQIKLKLPIKKDPLRIEARVAWIKDVVRDLSNRGVHKYRVGLEFASLKSKDKRILSSFIKSISA